MKIFDRSAPIRRKSSNFSAILGRIGFKPKEERPSASTILASNLEKMLDDRYVLMNNLSVGNWKTQTPAVLVGPAGLWVIYASDAEGIYRAEGSRWEQLQKRGQKYLPIKPNPFLRVISMTAAVEEQLRENHLEYPGIEPVVFFSNPGVHVDGLHPAARVVMPDSLSRFVAGFTQSGLLLDRESVRNITRVLCEQDHGFEEPVIGDIQDRYSLQDSPPNNIARRTPLSGLPKDEPAITRKVPFSRPQWIVLVLLVFVNIIVLTTLVMVVLINK